MKEEKETFKDLKCSPSNDDKTEFSCYSANELNKNKRSLNTRHPDRLIIATDPHETWNELRKCTANSCKNERCCCQLYSKI